MYFKINGKNINYTFFQSKTIIHTPLVLSIAVLKHMPVVVPTEVKGSCMHMQNCRTFTRSQMYMLINKT